MNDLGARLSYDDLDDGDDKKSNGKITTFIEEREREREIFFRA